MQFNSGDVFSIPHSSLWMAGLTLRSRTCLRHCLGTCLDGRRRYGSLQAMAGLMVTSPNVGSTTLTRSFWPLVGCRSLRVDEESPAPFSLPPTDLVAPNLVELVTGTRIHRIHGEGFDGNDFNPCQGSPTRFAPIRDDQGRCIPSLYASEDFESAAYETIFHDIDLSATRKTVPIFSVETRVHSILSLRRTLQLASLRQPDLLNWDIRRESLIGSLPTQFANTARWAKAIHDQFGDLEGLIWTSNQCDPASAFVLFGDRVPADDLFIETVRMGASESFLNDVRSAGRRGGIVITN